MSMRNLKNNKKYNDEFFVGKGDYTPLIGSRASQQVTTNAASLTLDQVKEVFEMCSKDKAA